MKTYLLEFVVPGITVLNKSVVAGSVEVNGDNYDFLDEKGKVIISLPTKNVKIINITKSWNSYSRKRKTDDTNQ